MKSPQLPDYGYLPRWPHDGDDVIHPEDVAAARYCFRTQSIFRRDSFDGTYYHCVYGDHRFRMKPCLWLPVRSEGIDIGDWVETTGVGMSHEIFVATVQSMEFSDDKSCIVYKLQNSELTYHTEYVASDFRLLEQKVELRPRDEFRLEPKSGDSGYGLKEES